MFPNNYRVDKETGAVIFKKSAGRQKVQQMEFDIRNLSKRVELLETQNEILLSMLLDNKFLTPEQICELKNLSKTDK